MAVMTVSLLSGRFWSLSAFLSTLSELPTLKLSFPHPMSDGNDYELKCDIMNVTPVQNLVVTWFAGNQTLHTQTFNESSVIPVSVVSTLNITADRRLIGEVFRCDAKLDLGPLDPEFQLPTQSLFMALDVLCRSSPSVVFTAFYWLRLFSVLYSFCCRPTRDPTLSRWTDCSGAGAQLGFAALRCWWEPCSHCSVVPWHISDQCIGASHQGALWDVHGSLWKHTGQDWNLCQSQRRMQVIQLFSQFKR